MSFDKNNKLHIAAVTTIVGVTTVATVTSIKRAVKRKKEREALNKNKEEFAELLEILCELSCEVTRLAEENNYLKTLDTLNGNLTLKHRPVHD